MSCLVEKFSYYLDLTEDEKSLLDLLEKDTKEYKKHTDIYEQNGDSDFVYVIKEGWCASYSRLVSGGRQIFTIHYPGDIVGTTTLPFQTNVCGLVAATNTVVCPFPKSGMKHIFSTSPKMASLFYSMSMQDNVVLIDKMKAIGRMSGEDRLALFLLQIWTRLKVTNRSMDTEFTMPLSQEFLADALGLTTVYINQMMKQLQQQSCIKVEGKKITLLDVERLMQRCDFEDRYYKLDTSWYPESRHCL